MSFKDAMNFLKAQLIADATLSGYVDSSQVLIGFRENYPLQEYTIILEPDTEEEQDDRQTGDGAKETSYTINIHCRIGFTSPNWDAYIIGDSNRKGMLDFVEDVKHSIRLDFELGYNRKASSTSDVNAGTNFNLSSSQKNIKVSVNGRTPTGYGTIFCGDSLLTGAQVASNIQDSLRGLGLHSDDGYYGITCAFDNTAKTFLIETTGYDPAWF